MKRFLMAVAALMLMAPPGLNAQTVTLGGVRLTCNGAGVCTMPALGVKPDTIRLKPDTVRLPAPPPIVVRDTLWCTVGGLCSSTPPVVVPPVVVLRPDFTAVCAGLVCTLDASPSTGIRLRFAWDLGKLPDRYTSGNPVTVTYPHDGTRDVVLTITDSAGKTASVGKTITVGSPVVTPPPPPPAPPPPPPPIDPGPVGPPGDHPRVWINAERLTRLRAQVAASSPRWLRVKSVADAQVAKATAAQSDGYTLPALCLAYLGTQDQRYATRAGAVLDATAVETNDLKYDSGYGFRFWLPVATMALDWCFNGLTVAQRTNAATWLMNRADWVWPESNPARVGGWGTNSVANNYWWGFLMTGPAALAAAGSDTGRGAISGTDRPSYHRALAQSKYSTQAAPLFATSMAGGAWDEGTNYESTWRMGALVDAYATAGITLDPTFLAQAARWRIQSTMPGGRYKVPFGDQPRASDASLYTYDRLSALYTLPFAPDFAGRLYGWLNLVGWVPQNEFNETAMLADELLRFDPAAPTAGFVDLPLGYVATGAGYALFRQSWTDPNATVVAFESGPIGDHGAKDANGLMIWKGSFWISATANLTSASGIEGATQNYNNLTVGGEGQRLFSGNRGTMDPPVFSDSLVVFRGQAKDTYGYRNEWTSTRFVDDFARTVAYLPGPDVLVIVDRVVAKDSAATKVFRWHSRNAPVIAGNTFTLANPAGDQRCLGTLAYPAGAVLGTQTFALGNPVGPVTSNAVTVTLPIGRMAVVVTVFQCAPGTPGPVVAQVAPADVRVTVAGRQVIVPMNDGEAVRLQ